MRVEPVTLSGRHVRLEPLAPAHFEPLWAVAQDAGLWRWTVNLPTSAADLERYLRTALEWQAQGTALPFAIVALRDGCLAGSTRYANIDHTHDRLEIGWTW